jgi:hypothetical protein
MKTAVEWLVEKHFGSIENCSPNFRKHIEQAKEMEKEQIMDAMDWIMNKYYEFHEQPTTSAREQYYNETFKSE